MILKTSKKWSNGVHGVMFSDMKKYVYSESVFNTQYIEIEQKCLKKFASDKINGTKYALFFLS